MKKGISLTSTLRAFCCRICHCSEVASMTGASSSKSGSTKTIRSSMLENGYKKKVSSRKRTGTNGAYSLSLLNPASLGSDMPAPVRGNTFFPIFSLSLCQVPAASFSTVHQASNRYMFFHSLSASHKHSHSFRNRSRSMDSTTVIFSCPSPCLSYLRKYPSSNKGGFKEN